MILFNVTRDGWTPGAIEFLVASWLPVKTVDIAEALGCSPHAIIGKANRIGLSRKPHPGQKHANPMPRVYQPSKENRHRQQMETTLAPLASLPVILATHMILVPVKQKPPETVPTWPTPPTPAPRVIVRTCQWIEGDTKPRLWCGAPCVGASSWCDEHIRRVFIRRSHLYQDAA